MSIPVVLFLIALVLAIVSFFTERHAFHLLGVAVILTAVGLLIPSVA